MSALDQTQSFDFPAVRTRVIFGFGTLGQLTALVKNHGCAKVLIVTDAGLVRAGVAEKVTKVLGEGGIPYTVFGEVPQDSSTQTIGRVLELLRKSRATSSSVSGEAAAWTRRRRLRWPPQSATNHPVCRPQ